MKNDILLIKIIDPFFGIYDMTMNLNDSQKEDLFKVIAINIFKIFELFGDEKIENLWRYDEIPIELIKFLNLSEKIKEIDLLIEKERDYYAVQCKFRKYNYEKDIIIDDFELVQFYKSNKCREIKGIIIITDTTYAYNKISLFEHSMNINIISYEESIRNSIKNSMNIFSMKNMKNLKDNKKINNDIKYSEIDMNKYNIFCKYCMNGDFDKIKQMINDSFIPLSKNNHQAFRLSCLNGNLHIAKYLYYISQINNEKVNINQHDNYIFRKSCINGHISVSKWLYELSNEENHTPIDIIKYINDLYIFNRQNIENLNNPNIENHKKLFEWLSLLDRYIRKTIKLNAKIEQMRIESIQIKTDKLEEQEDKDIVNDEYQNEGIRQIIDTTTESDDDISESDNDTTDSNDDISQSEEDTMESDDDASYSEEIIMKSNPNIISQLEDATQLKDNIIQSSNTSDFDHIVKKVVYQKKSQIEKNKKTKSKHKPYSKAQIIWLNELINIGEHIQHAENGKEHRIKKSLLKADGYSLETNTIFEFQGCYYHGCIECHPDRNKINEISKKTYDELYQNTLQKAKHCLDQGYNYIEIWECVWNRIKKDNDLLKEYLEDVKSMLNKNRKFIVEKIEPIKKEKGKSAGKVEKNINLNDLTMNELYEICEYYKKPKTGLKKEIIDRIMNINNYNYFTYLKNQLKKFTMDILKIICEDQNLIKTGLKKDLIDRIINNEKIIKICHYKDMIGSLLLKKWKLNDTSGIINNKQETVVKSKSKSGSSSASGNGN